MKKMVHKKKSVLRIFEIAEPYGDVAKLEGRRLGFVKARSKLEAADKAGRLGYGDSYGGVVRIYPVRKIKPVRNLGRGRRVPDTSSPLDDIFS